MTLTFEDANSKLLDVVSVADINALECEDYSLVEIMNLNISFNIEGDVLSKFWSKIFVKTLKLNIGQDLKAEVLSDFETEFMSRFEVDLKLNSGVI